MKKSDPPIVVEDTLSATTEAVWNALTRLDEMRLWYFDNIDEFKPEVGSRSRFPVVSEDRTFTHLWEVTEVIPKNRISYKWRFEEYPGQSLLTFSIEPGENVVQLQIITHILEDFPDGIPEFQRESCRGGWEYFMGRLKDYLS
jgi:uncharacterized protein YndB with AHSA1/START domain